MARVLTNGQPSLTAFTAAAARAAHLIVDHEPVIFADTLAEAMLGERADELIGYHRAHGTHPVLSGARAQVTCRSRYTEDRLADGVRRGIGQYIILGAGLDSFAGRGALAAPQRRGRPASWRCGGQAAQTMSVLRRIFAMRAAHASISATHGPPIRVRGL